MSTVKKVCSPRSDRRPIHFSAPGLKRYQTEEFEQRNPIEFVGISLTGWTCVLQCDHCRGRLLEGMLRAHKGHLVELCERLSARGTKGVLLSGGSDGNGNVPVLEFGEEICEIKRRLGMTVAVHTGLVSEALAECLAEAEIDAAMIDIVGDGETIRRVLHMQATVEDFDRSLARLAGHGVPMAPHIVLGLDYGRLVGERRALDMVSAYPVYALVIAILTPVFGTPMQDVEPPGDGELGRFFELARQKLPDARVSLGCARPMGLRKLAIDRMAVEAGFDGIAYPAEGTVAYAVESGRRPVFKETCCAVL